MKKFINAAALASLWICAGEAAVSVPAFTGFAEPNPHMKRSKEGVVENWSDPAQTISWFGEIKKPGSLSIDLKAALPAGESSSFRLVVAPVEGKAQPVELSGELAGAAEPVRLNLGKMEVEQPGYFKFSLTGTEKSAASFGNLIALELDGPAAEGAHFCTVDRRNAASVHLAFKEPKGAKVAWFYNEVVAREEPLHTFYMACGFHRGYFGMQVNNGKERRIIFSVWDSGNEGVDRAKVADEDKVKLLAKGEGVVASDFGNEGTGGHSHLVYSWKKDEPYRFLLGAQPENRSTVYTAYFWFPEKKAWGLIASFRAPKDGAYLKGLHSFNENFGGENGHLRRLAEFGPQWVKDADGTWHEILEATFSHDGHGEHDRLDRSMGVKEGRFYLSNGGFLAESIKYGTPFTRPSSGATPPEQASAGAKP